MAVPAIFLFLLSVAYYPSRPPTPPSNSSTEERWEFLVNTFYICHISIIFLISCDYPFKDVAGKGDYSFAHQLELPGSPALQLPCSGTGCVITSLPISWHFQELKSLPVKFKGTVIREFLLLLFHKSVSPKPLIRPFQIFPKIRGDIRSSRFATGVVDTGGKWKKSSIRIFFMISFGHLYVVELAYRYFFQAHFKLSAVW